MISAQNTRLPTAPLSVIPLKPVCGPDDGSDAGPWYLRPAAEIDGTDKRVLRAASTLSTVILGQAQRDPRTHLAR